MTQQGQMASSPLTDISDIEHKAALSQKLSGASLESTTEQQARQVREEREQSREDRLPGTTESTLECCADFALYPLGTSHPFSSFIEQVEKVLKQYGLEYKVHEHGTVMKGDTMTIMRAIKACHEAAHALASCRIVSNVRLDTGMKNYTLTTPSRPT